MRRVVQRLAGCLGNLPDRLRTVLVLRTGVGLTRAYSAATVAALLHIGARDVTGLERQALRQLRLSARTSTCGAAGGTWATSGVLFDAFGAFGPPIGGAGLAGGESAALGSEGGALGEVKALRDATPFLRDPSGTDPYRDGNATLGVNLTPGSADMWLGVAMIVVGAVLAALLFADDQRRARWLPRRPR